MVEEIHSNFNQTVLEGRKGKLQADPKELFSGDFWPGRTALKLGLVDGLGNLFGSERGDYNFKSGVYLYE